MAKLIYSAIASLDGYVEDAGGRFDWAEPDEEVFCFVNDLERPIFPLPCQWSPVGLAKSVPLRI